MELLVPVMWIEPPKFWAILLVNSLLINVEVFVAPPSTAELLTQLLSRESNSEVQ